GAHPHLPPFPPRRSSDLGRTLIATRTGCLTDLKPRFAPLLAEPGRPNELAGRLLGFLRRPEDLEALSAELAGRLIDRWSAQRMARETVDFYHEVRGRTRLR